MTESLLTIQEATDRLHAKARRARAILLRLPQKLAARGMRADVVQVVQREIDAILVQLDRDVDRTITELAPPQ